MQINKAAADENTKKLAKDFFKKLEEHDEQALSLWKEFRDFSIKEYTRIYKVQTIHAFSVLLVKMVSFHLLVHLSNCQCTQHLFFQEIVT